MTIIFLAAKKIIVDVNHAFPSQKFRIVEEWSRTKTEELRTLVPSINELRAQTESHGRTLASLKALIID
ncbi:MAG: hypothetical protein DMG05_13000 [Acidobacteria bacterium]|nr:MAG: hypothetical protein DMG05_13000 [Acidobacteriota bacterium]